MLARYVAPRHVRPALRELEAALLEPSGELDSGPETGDHEDWTTEDVQRARARWEALGLVRDE